MALATQCPHCHTTFKVAHDQLKLRSGLVRCGACKQIFNGIENLVAPEQANAGAGESAQEKVMPAAPAAAAPASSSSASPAFSPAPAPKSVSAAAAPETSGVPQQAELPASSDVGQSAINALEFVAIDDPETRTRILDAGTEPDAALPTDQPHAPDSAPIDEDPLTRMTLVDFSVFDEDPAKAATGSADAPPTEPSPATERHGAEIWPDTREQIEPKTLAEAAQPEGPVTIDASAGQSAAPALPDDTGTASPTVGDEAVINQAIGEPTPANNAPTDAQSPAAAGAQPLALAATDAHAAAAEQSASAPSTDINPAFIDEQEYDQEDSPAPALAAEEESSAEDDTDEPDFVTSERRRQQRRRIQRIIMAIGSVVLLAVLLTQAAYIFRSQLAVRFPQSRPLLSQLCDVTGCQILLPAQIEQVSIESNELQMQAGSKNVFTLSLLLHNRSTVPQAWPHIELTLNDKDGKALVRRVLAPKEYLPADRRSAEGMAARSEQPVNVSFELNQLQASDYRVYLFYP